MSNGKSILVIEDEDSIARALKLKLTKSGFDVTVASDGEEGLGKIDDVQPELIILDLIMPNMDGFGVLENIQDRDIPVFVLSNLSQEEDRRRVEELGADEFFIKSNIQISEVVEKINEFFSE